MPTIKLLDKSVAELIAAGEVIERPSSVIKELIENSIDAGAEHITVEIKNGGISYMRITDDGCGIAYDEIPTAFLRHATSKISNGGDLVSIGTLGFRGEALASVAAVSRIEMMTRQHGEELGGRYVIEGGEQTEYEQCGCPAGTTIIIRDLFFNTPARLKFLKKDVSEGNFAAAVVDKLALANPHISFRFIRDNKSQLVTSGDGDGLSAVKAVYGRQLSDSLLPVDFTLNNIEVKGFVSSPLFCRASRSMQVFFVNSRYIKSTTCMAALEEAYRNSTMTGKYPACVLNIKIPPDVVDVNVHPAKTEIRFAYEKPVFDAVYLAAKNALLCGADMKRQIQLEKPAARAQYTPEKYFARNPVPPAAPAEQTVLEPEAPQKAQSFASDISTVYNIRRTASALNSPVAEYSVSADGKESQEKAAQCSEKITAPSICKPAAEALHQPADEAPIPDQPPEPCEAPFRYINIPQEPVRLKTVTLEQAEEEKEIRVIGEFAATYIICEAEGELILIDKHAAHERIRFEKLRSEFTSTSQLLLEETSLKLSAQEYDALSEYYSYVEQAGIELIFEENTTVKITAVPSLITLCSPQEIVCDIAKRLICHSTSQSGALFDDILHTMACKSAIKANDRTDITQLEALARRVYNDKSIRFCPHGRPVMAQLTKSRIEHFFGRH